MSSSDTTDMMFTNSHTTPLYSSMWTPTTSAGYAGTCIFIIFLASIFRALFAVRTVLEQRWLARARNRRYILVKGQAGEAGKIESDPDAKTGTLVTARGVEENIKVVTARVRGTIPFRLSVDVPRAAIFMVITGVGYLLMLVAMTMNVGYFMSLLAGTFIGELAIGRYIVYEEH